MSEDILTFSRQLINSCQGVVVGVSLCLISMFRKESGEQVVRLRLQASGGKDQSTSIDSSKHHKLIAHLKHVYPLLHFECNQNYLDNKYEIDVAMPTDKEAWRRTATATSNTLQSSNRFVRSIQLVCVLVMLSVLVDKQLVSKMLAFVSSYTGKH